MTWTTDTVEALANDHINCAANCRAEKDGSSLDDVFESQAQYHEKTASALTWVLQAYKIEMAARRGFEAALQRAMADRNAANARAESARNDALEEAAIRMDELADRVTIPGTAGESLGNYLNAKKIAGMPYRQAASAIRALKEAGK